MIDVIGSPPANAWIELRRLLVETNNIVPFLQYGGKRYGWNLDPLTCQKDVQDIEQLIVIKKKPARKK